MRVRIVALFVKVATVELEQHAEQTIADRTLAMRRFADARARLRAHAFSLRVARREWQVKCEARAHAQIGERILTIVVALAAAAAAAATVSFLLRAPPFVCSMRVRNQKL